MPVLQNQRWELYAQHVAAGKTSTEAYELAGFKRSRSNAARLCEISLESVCRELDEAISVARAKGQAAPLVNEH